MEVFNRLRNIVRPFCYGCFFGVLLMFGGLMADKYGLIEGLIERVFAASGTIRPNGNGNLNEGTPFNCDGGGTSYECLDDPVTYPTAPATTSEDYLVHNWKNVDFFQMSNNINDVATVTRIIIYVYHQEGGTNMQLNASLWDVNETTQYATTTFFTNRTTFADWDVADIGGLNLSQSELTGLRIRLECLRSGGGGASDCTSVAMYADVEYDPQVDLTVSSVGSQPNRIDIGTTSAHVGGAFVISDNTGSRDVTSINIEETGTVDADATLTSVRLYYENSADCSSEVYNGTESLYDTATTFNASNIASFSDTGIGTSPGSDLCLYPVLGVSTTTASSSQTVALQITDPSTDVTGGGSAVVEPDTVVSFGNSTILEAAALNQKNYHWRQDNGDEGDTASGADSATGGSENTIIPTATNDTHYRLRLGVSNIGNATSSANQYRLEYATQVTNCSSLTEGDWTDVDAATDAWDMVNSNDVNFNDGNTTNITTASKGALTDTNVQFDGTGAARETTSLSGAITLDPDEFTELEYSLNASASIIDGTTYCFRVTNNGTKLDGYTEYPEITFAADVSVAAEEAQPSTVSIPTPNVYVGGFLITDNTGSHDLDEITITASSTVADITQAFENIELYYENDTSNPYTCDGISYGGGETQYGGVSGQTIANFAGDGTATFTGGVGTTPTVTQTSAVCLYVVLDVTATSTNGDLLDIKIQDASTDVVLDSGTVAPVSTVPLSGVTTLVEPSIEQLHYHWRQNNGTEATASSSVGAEDTSFDELPVNTVQRLRFGIANTGGETSGNYQYELEWAQRTQVCSLLDETAWKSIDTGGDEWSMVASQLTDNGDTTNIDNSYGGVTNVGTFLGTNSGQQSTDGITNNIDLPANNWLELEYSIQADNTAPEGARYCFRVTNNGTPLDNVAVYPEATIKLGTDFAVTRNSFNLTASSTRLYEGIDYDLQFGSSSRAFIRITNSHHTGGGPGGGTTGNSNADDTTVYISDPGNIETSVEIRRATFPTASTRVTWEVVEYIGVLGGENEIYVHDAGTISYLSGDSAVTSGAVTPAVTNDADIVPFITGQYNADTGRQNYNYGLSTSVWNSGADTVSVTRSETGSAGVVSYAIVEFRGSNWRVHRVQEDYQQNPGNTDTESFGPLETGDITKAFVHAQHRVGNGQDDHASFGHEVWISSMSAVSFRLNGVLAAGEQADHVSVAWVVENVQTTGEVMVVQQEDGIIPDGGGGLTTTVVTLGSEIDDLTTASFFMNNSNSDTGRSYPESLISGEIISTTEVELQVSDDAGINAYRFEVVEWPTAAAKLIQNDFWLYEDNDALTPTTPWGGLTENEQMTANDNPIATGESIRIRMNIEVTAAAQPAGADSFQLEYAERISTCGALGDNDWLEVGDSASTTIWRAHDNGTVTDGAAVTTSFILSESTVAGTYEENNPSALTPNLALVTDSIEFDWSIENNGAVDKTDYCFRMVYADGSDIESWSTYPVIRTVGYGPEMGDWKWFNDEDNVTPTDSIVDTDPATNTAPIDISFDDPIKLRAVITEKDGASGDPAKFKLQYSEYANFSEGVYDVVATSTCTASSTWCYFNGAGVDNATITESVLGGLSGPCSGGVGAGCGTHNEGSSSSTATLVQPAYSSQEFEFTIVHAGARANAVYYFRLFDVVNNEVMPASSTHPSLVTEGAGLTFTLGGVTAGTEIDGEFMDANTSSSSILFSDIPFDTEYTAGYRMNVTTNATEGYKILMRFDQLPTNTYGSVIESVTGTNAAPTGWSTGCAAEAASCFGYHIEDDLLEGGSPRFGANDTYAAVSTTTAEEVMYSSVPIDDSHDIVFKIVVRELQPAGDYEANITLISIPIF